jgi:hypothetical protein
MATDQIDIAPTVATRLNEVEGPPADSPRQRQSSPLPPPPKTSLNEPDNPLSRLTPEQIEELGREFDAIHDEVYGELG